MTDDDEVLAALEEEFDPETVVEILAERVANLERNDVVADAPHSFDRIDTEVLAELLWECSHRVDGDGVEYPSHAIPPLADTPKHQRRYRVIAEVLGTLLLDPDRTPLR